jgi:hypothetical protein
MVSKCANPDCSVPFRYFHTGQLFRVDTATGLDRRRSMGQDSSHKALRRLEFFWLCENCAGKLTLIFDKESGIAVRAKERVNEYASSAAA